MGKLRRSFFWIDFLACYPATYISLIFDDSGSEDDASGSTKALKLVRVALAMVSKEDPDFARPRGW